MQMPVEWKRTPDRPRAPAERGAVSREAELQIWHQRSHGGNVEYRFPASVSWRDDSFAFFDHIDAVDGGNLDLFFSAPTPMNLHAVPFRCSPPTQVQPPTPTRSIACPPADIPPLPRA